MQFRLSALLLLFVVLWSSLAVFGGWWGVAVFVAAVAAALFLQKLETAAIESLPWLAITIVVVCLLVLIGLLLPAVESAREAAPGAQCFKNLHNIALALRNYETKFRTLPPAYTVDKNGRPMHSWRVLILPFLGCDNLYKRYNFNEP